MKNSGLMKYKGYTACPEYVADERIFYGRVLGISDLVDFQSDSAGELEREFHAAVDDYLAFCEEIGKSPQREYNGSFNVRISPELHREVSVYAQTEGITLNKAVERAIRTMVRG